MGWKVAVYTNPPSIKVRYRWYYLIAFPVLPGSVSCTTWTYLAGQNFQAVLETIPVVCGITVVAEISLKGQSHEIGKPVEG
jgi:hypothetical protein